MIKKGSGRVNVGGLGVKLPSQEVSPDMGSLPRQSPKFLGRKLRQIRHAIDGGLSQDEMVARLGLYAEIDRTYVSRYESGALEPPLNVLLRYAELAGLHLEVLADDDVLIPDKIPCSPKSEGIKKPTRKGGRKR